jgi:glutathione S-transferase
MAIDDVDLIDPDPEARRSTLGASAWLDHCREADAFLLDALKVLDSDLSRAKVSAARKKETASVARALERVRVNVTSRPNETLVKMANVGHEEYVAQCDEAKQTLEHAIDVLERPFSEDGDGMTLDGERSTRGVSERRALVAQGLRRARAVVSRVAPNTDVRASADPERDANKKRCSKPSSTPAKTTTYRLAYMDIKGLAEPTRLALFLGGVPFTETRVSYEDLSLARTNADASTSLPFGQLPTLTVEETVFAEDGDKEKKNGVVKKSSVFGQSAALLRYVGRKTNLYPVDDERQLRVDAVEECLADLRKTFTPLWYANALPRDPTNGALSLATALSESQKKGALDSVRDAHFPARLRQIEALLGSRAGLPCDFSENEKDFSSNASSSGPYVCGAAMTIADLSLYVLLDGLEADATHKYCAPLATGFVKGFIEKECPRLKRLYDAVRFDKRVERWNEERWGIPR